MQIPISVRNCRVAVAAALVAMQAKVAEDREAHRKNSYQRLHDGAVHNGLNPSKADLEQMQAMVDRDIEHTMSQHPGAELIKVFETQLKMMDYTHEDIVVIDEQDFHLLEAHLPPRERKLEEMSERDRADLK